MNIAYSKQAAKAINGMDKPTKQRIRTAIELLPDGDVKLLQGRISVYRLRVEAGAYCFLIRIMIQ